MPFAVVMREVWWCGGVVVWRCHDVVVSWCGGVMVWWCHGVVVPWCGGGVVYWCGGEVVDISEISVCGRFQEICKIIPNTITPDHVMSLQ